MSKLLEKYLQEISGSCGGGCGSASSGGCCSSPIKRGGSGTATDYRDVEDIAGYNSQGAGEDPDYKTSWNPDYMPDTLFTHEDNESFDDDDDGDLDDQYPDELSSSQMKSTELPEGGGEAGEKKINEQEIPEEEEEVPKIPKEEPPANEPVQTPMAQTELPAGGGEAGAEAGMPGEAPMGVGGEEQVPQDPKYIGRVYELKKIYARLVSIESFLNDASDPKLLKLRKYISSTIELFQTLINNISAYIDNIDDLIVLFYKFLLIVYSILRKYYKEEEKDDKQDLIRGIHEK